MVEWAGPGAGPFHAEYRNAYFVLRPPGSSADVVVELTVFHHGTGMFDSPLEQALFCHVCPTTL